MSTYEKTQTLKNVFYKLEKFYRLRRLEKKLGLIDEKMEDEEKHLKAYLTSWEGFRVQPEPILNF